MARCLDAARLVRRDDERARLLEHAVEQLGALRVERVVRLVEQQQLRLVQEHAAKTETLLHAARERRDARVADVPEAEALEQHPDALAALGQPIEPREERQVLERRQLAVDERLVAEIADGAAPAAHLAAGRRREPCENAQERRLPRSVRAGDEEELPVGELDVDVAKDAPVAVAHRERAPDDHAR